MRVHSTYWYLIIALALFGYILFGESRMKSTPEQSQAERRILDFEPAQVQTMSITGPKGTVGLRLENNRWMIAEPVQAPADGARVEGILDQLAVAENSRKIPPSEFQGGSLAQWGLEPPMWTISIKTARQAYRLQIGRDVAASDAAYARVSDKADEPVQLIPQTLKIAVEKNLTELRSHAIFEYTPKEIAGCGVREFTSTGQPTMEGEATITDGKGALVKPLMARTDPTRLATWLRQALELNVHEFTSDEAANLSAYGLSNPTAQIWIKPTGADAEENVLLLGSTVPEKSDEIYAKRLKGNTIFTLKKTAVSNLLTTFPEVRDRHIAAFNPNDVAKLTFESQGQSVTVTKDDFGWKIDGDTSMADTGRITAFLRRLSEEVALNFVKDSATDLKSYGLDKPREKVLLTFAKDKKPETMEVSVGGSDNTQAFVKTSAEPFVYGVPPDFAEGWPKDNIDIRRLVAVELDRGKITRIEYQSLDAPTLNLERSSLDALPQAVPPAAQPVDTNSAEVQMSLLAALRPRKWLGKPKPEYGLAKPVRRFVIYTGTAQTAIRIGASLPEGGRAAQVEGQPYVFELRAADWDYLSPLPLVVQRPDMPPVAPQPAPTAPSTNGARARSIK